MGKPSQKLLKKLRVARVPVQMWNSILKADWWKKLGFMLICSVLGLLFLPCMIPCLIRLIHSGIQGIQITAMPIDPDLAAKKKTNTLMILKARSTHTQGKGTEKRLNVKRIH